MAALSKQCSRVAVNALGDDGSRCKEEDNKDDVVMLEGDQSVETPLENEEPATDIDLVNESSNAESEFEANSQGKQL